MVNFTGYIQVGNDFINTQAINDFHYDEPKNFPKGRGITLSCVDGKHKFIQGVTPIELMQKCQEAEKTGFSVIA